MRRLDFRILGPLEVRLGGQRAQVPEGRQRTLLAALLLSAGEVVGVDELVERLWCQCLPLRPRNGLHTCLTRLRHSLEEYGEGLSDLIQAPSTGYRIDIDAIGLDLIRFRALCGAARRAREQGDPGQEFLCLTEALALWRGPALPDVRSDSLHREVIPKLTEEWVQATERRHEVGLKLGRQDELIGELRVLAQRHPFHERFWFQLMLALYRSGRQGEALREYVELSTRLREELGIDPSQQVQRLHTAILRKDPELVAAESARPAASTQPQT